MNNFRALGTAIGLYLSAIVFPCRALIFLSTGDPEHNVSAPTGELAGSGWQWEQQDGFGATVIGPNQVLTANHLGVGVNNTFHFGGLTYAVLAATNAPGSDLRLFWVAGRFPGPPAPIYSGTNEIGSVLVLHGQGVRRGDPVYSNPPANTDLRGWLWGHPDGRNHWGTNRIADIQTVDYSQGMPGTYLIAYFNKSAGADAVTLASGDSGGGAFIRDTDGNWKLAGIASATEAYFNTVPSATGAFYAALFDRRGFYEQDDTGHWTFDPGADQQPGALLELTRVSTYAAWIQGQLALPTPGTAVPTLLTSEKADGIFLEVTAYAIDPVKRRVTVATSPENTRFYQLAGVSQILSIQREADWTVLGY